VRDGPQGPGDPGVTRPKYPPGLGDGGRRLWAEVKAARKELGPGEAVLLEEACRMKDRLDRLAIQLTGNPFVEFLEEEGKDGDAAQFVLTVNSAMAEARLTATALRGYMISLGLEKGGEGKATGPGTDTVGTTPTRRGGPRAPKMVGLDEAATDPDAPKAPEGEDPLSVARAKRAARESTA
jgi:hypothetical protein